MLPARAQARVAEGALVSVEVEAVGSEGDDVVPALLSPELDGQLLSGHGLLEVAELGVSRGQGVGPHGVGGALQPAEERGPL